VHLLLTLPRQQVAGELGQWPTGLWLTGQLAIAPDTFPATLSLAREMLPCMWSKLIALMTGENLYSPAVNM